MNEGIEILVHDGRWDALGLDTPRNHELFAILQSIGGINESVEDGVYVFNAEPLDNENLVLTLEEKV